MNNELFAELVESMTQRDEIVRGLAPVPRIPAINSCLIRCLERKSLSRLSGLGGRGHWQMWPRVNRILALSAEMHFEHWR